MPKLVCVKCKVELKIERNGVKVVELFQDNLSPYRVWDTDKWKCPSCRYEIIASFADRPLMEHFQGDIEKFIKDLRDAGNEIVYDGEL
jgi:acetone carboxylase gamma subunit